MIHVQDTMSGIFGDYTRYVKDIHLKNV